MKYALSLVILFSPVLAMQGLDSSLALAVELNGAEDIEKRLDEGVDVNSQDVNGITMLYEACSRGYQELALLLLERGADPTISPSFTFCSRSVLHNAIDQEMLLVVEATLKSRIVLPDYDKDSYQCILTFLCSLTVEREEIIELPTEVVLLILQSSDELCIDVLSLYNGNDEFTLQQKLKGAASILGVDGVCRGLAKHCMPLIKNLLSRRGLLDKDTAPEFAREKHEALKQSLPEGSHFEADYMEQHSAIYELLREDTFEQRLPDLIKKWFFT